MSLALGAEPARPLRSSIATASAMALALCSSVAALRLAESIPLGILLAFFFTFAELIKLSLPAFVNRMRFLEVRGILLFVIAASIVGSILFLHGQAAKPQPAAEPSRSYQSMAEYVDYAIWKRTKGCLRVGRDDWEAEAQCADVPDSLIYAEQPKPKKLAESALPFWFWAVVALQLVSLAGPVGAITRARLRPFAPAPAAPEPLSPPEAEDVTPEPISPPPPSSYRRPDFILLKPPVREEAPPPRRNEEQPITVEFEEVSEEPKKVDEPSFDVKQRRERRDEVTGEGFVLGASARPKPIQWLMPGVLMAGAFNLLSGQGGVGKSSIAASLAALTSKVGARWPTGEPVESGAVIMCEVEDNINSVVIPRLMACEANMERIMLRGDPMDLSESISKLEEYVDRLERHCATAVRLIILSPVRMFFGGKESYNNQEVRRRLKALLTWAEGRGVCILGIHHPTENKAFGGSAAWLELARSGMFAEWEDGEGSQRYVRPLKANNAPIGWRIPYHTVGAYPDGYETSLVVWGAKEFIGAAPATPRESDSDESVKSGDTMARPGPRVKPLSAKEKAAHWLAAILADGPKDRADFEAERARDGIGETALNEAAADMGIVRDELDEFGNRRRNNAKTWCTPDQYTARQKLREERQGDD